MKRSTKRILTTHCGSLARPPDLFEMLSARSAGLPYDAEAFSQRVREAVAEAVRKQVDAGLDVVCDGEQGRSSFFGYVMDRLTGFETKESEGRKTDWARSREVAAFPEYYAWYSRGPTAGAAPRASLVCTGAVTYQGQTVLQTDIEVLKASVTGLKVEEVFMPSVSPSTFEAQYKNEFYTTDEDYLYAIADALREEYVSIVNAGFLLQIDDPELVTHYVTSPESSIDECRRWAQLRVEALNHAIHGIPPDRVRFHTCYGINIGPRVHELPLKDIVDVMLSVNAGAYSFEAANPRHEHEWQVWESVDLPPGKTIIPGVISHTTNLVEHPELVAQRLIRYANIVGRESVIAGSDCGFSSVASAEPEVHPSVVWAKFQAMAEGAKLASEQLWR